MQLDKLIKLGRLNRSHGLKGGLKATINSLYIEQFSNLSHIFLKKGEDFLPFFITSIEGWHNNNCIIYLEEITERTRAEELQHNDFYASTNLIEEAVVIDLDQQLNGMQVYANNNLFLGIVEKIEYLPQQIILQIIAQEKIIPLPYNDNFVVSINEKENKINVTLPEGYLDIFS